MSFNNRNYNTRNSGRFNRPGSFVPASSTELVARLQNHQTFEVQSRLEQNQPAPAPAPVAPLPPPPQPPQSLQPLQLLKLDNSIKEEDTVMNEVPSNEGATAGEESSAGGARLPFFKTKLAGVKKISNKERRRRQNALLRRITSPKNALMCINEMLPNEQIANQFKVEAAPQDSYYNRGIHNFCAELALDGVTYRGYGENKLSARNAAAEQAIRDIVLKKMERYSELMQLSSAASSSAPSPANNGSGGAAGGGGEGGAEQAIDTMVEEGEALPMIQLLSFALHKLFAEWESAGHHVPQLRAGAVKQSQSAFEEEMLDAAPGPAAAPPRPKKPRKVPDNASAMHPAMLLTILRPQAVYRELGTEGDKPQNMIFTIAVDIEGQTFVGKAPSKKEARKAAARAACKGILGITFDDERGAAPLAAN